MRRVIVLGALLLVGLAIAQSFGLMDRNHRVSRAWAWEGEVPGEGWVHLRNRSGSIRIEEGSGPAIELVASKSWTGRRPQDVEFIANRVGDDVYICALYGGGDESDCDEDDYDNRETNWFMRKFMRSLARASTAAAASLIAVMAKSLLNSTTQHCTPNVRTMQRMKR